MRSAFSRRSGGSCGRSLSRGYGWGSGSRGGRLGGWMGDAHFMREGVPYRLAGGGGRGLQDLFPQGRCLSVWLRLFR